MADRGFDIQDLMAAKQAKLFIPPKRQSTADQFSEEDCFETIENTKCKNPRRKGHQTCKRVAYI